jgi:hypothetical protein
MVSMIQVGLDMAPTPTQISTWKSDCANYNRTRAAWDAMQKQIADFNAAMVSNHQQEIKMSPSSLAEESCSFLPEPSDRKSPR